MAARGNRFANVWQNGFTLLETLVCLGLSALLALAVLSAVSTFRRAAETEDAAATAERLLNDIASSLRLAPDADLPPLPAGWRAETERFEEPPVAAGYPRLAGTRVTLFPPAGALEPVSFAIYDLPRPEKTAAQPPGETP
ncbi:MAG: prepilin-type N-terminal cleavage/methylation domain-containing protein [Kiritimatiellae bacterium]|nr:prepilin-type N-terminal cleavage/methylation domain-containing protein [Kiritimatiellia bacterium]